MKVNTIWQQKASSTKCISNRVDELNHTSKRNFAKEKTQGCLLINVMTKIVKTKY